MFVESIETITWLHGGYFIASTYEMTSESNVTSLRDSTFLTTEVPMGAGNDVRHYARLSLISVMVTAIAITVNHLYSLGASAFVLGAALLVIPAALLDRFTSTGSRSRSSAT